MSDEIQVPKEKIEIKPKSLPITDDVFESYSTERDKYITAQRETNKEPSGLRANFVASVKMIEYGYFSISAPDAFKKYLAPSWIGPIPTNVMSAVNARVAVVILNSLNDPLEWELV